MQELINQSIKKIMRISLLHRIGVDRETSSRGLYFGQLPLLDYIRRNDGCTQVQLSQYMQVSAPSVARSVSRMERAGMLRRTGDASDRRCNQLSVTPQGIRVAEECRAQIDALDRKMLEGFSPDEIQRLLGCLDRILRNLSTDGAEEGSLFSLVVQANELHRQNDVK